MQIWSWGYGYRPALGSGFTTRSLPLQLDHRGTGVAQQLLDRVVAFDLM
jgi:hypothetical protein